MSHSSVGKDNKRIRQHEAGKLHLALKINHCRSSFKFNKIHHNSPHAEYFEIVSYIIRGLAVGAAGCGRVRDLGFFCRLLDFCRRANNIAIIIIIYKFAAAYIYEIIDKVAALFYTHHPSVHLARCHLPSPPQENQYSKHKLFCYIYVHRTHSPPILHDNIRLHRCIPQKKSHHHLKQMCSVLYIQNTYPTPCDFLSNMPSAANFEYEKNDL